MHNSNQAQLDKTNSKRRSASKKPTNTWKGFISCELSNEDKQVLKTTDLFGSYPQESTVASLVTLGFKVSQNRDWKNDSYVASLTDNDTESPTCGYTLTGRGGSPAKAMAALFYKHFVLLEDGWETPTEKDDEYS